MQYVYLMKTGKNLYKVGITHNVSTRKSQLQAYYPEKIEVVFSKYADTNAYTIEQELHASLVEWKASGANEWFILTPDQAIELCIRINKYPDIDISEKATLAKMVQLQRTQQKIIEKKLDHVLNAYEKFRYKPEPAPKQTIEVQRMVELFPPKISKEEEDEEIYQDALRVVREEGKASTSLLQRKLRIGYGRAAGIIERLEEERVVGMADGSRPRTLLLPDVPVE